MRKHGVTWLILLAILLLLVAACAPKAAPVATPTPVGLREVPAVASPTGPVLRPEDAAWAKVVEAAKKEGAVTVYTYWGADTNLKLQRRFKEKYGISLEFIVGRGGEQLERLMTERRMGKMVGDVFATGAPSVLGARKNDLTTSLGELPVLREKDVWVLPPDTYSPDKQILCINYQAYPSAVNTKQLSPADAPRSYRDLISPTWKGRIIATSPTIVTGLYAMFIPLINQGIVDMDFMKALGKQDISFQVSLDAAFQALARGERPFFLDAVDSVLAQYIAQGAPIKPVVLNEVTVTQVVPLMAVIKEAPHPNAAKLFANWLLTREGQDVYSEAQSFHSIRRDVPDYTPPAARFTATKLLNITLEEVDQQAKWFNDKVFPKLWEK